MITLEMLLNAGLPTMTSEEFEQSKVNDYNAMPGDLKHYDCPKCLNKGRYARLVDGKEAFFTCDCLEKRKSNKQLDESGLKDTVRRYTFGTYSTGHSWQAKVKSQALEYVEDEDGWFCITGQSGSGKTHICTAIAGGMIAKGVPTRYFKWREDGKTAKGLVGSSDYDKFMRNVREIKCLYIDDFLKAKDGRVTDGDVNLAFDIINSRYCNAGLLTIISSELSIDRIISIDEAIGSRIYERSKRHYINLVGQDKNIRLE